MNDALQKDLSIDYFQRKSTDLDFYYNSLKRLLLWFPKAGEYKLGFDELKLRWLLPMM